MSGSFLCECGCDEPAPIAKMTKRSKGHIKGRPVRFISGHNRVGSGSVALTLHRGSGRLVINCRDGTKYYYARAVLENKLGRRLVDDEVAHHRDEDKMNNDPDNLEVIVNQAEHARLHGIKRGGLNVAK